jgi:hypothetical protein
MEAQVVRRYDARVAYHGEPLGDFGALKMDHIVQKQRFAHTFRAISFERTEHEEDARWLAVNRLDNFVPCPEADQPHRRRRRVEVPERLGHGPPQCGDLRGLYAGEEYLQDGSRALVGRDTTRAISVAMGVTIKWCRHTLANEGDMSMLEG